MMIAAAGWFRNDIIKFALLSEYFLFFISVFLDYIVVTLSKI